MKKHEQILRTVHQYLIFFLVIAFVLICCLSLFLTVMVRNLGITLDENSISSAAKLTFANVLFLSVLFTVIDRVRRRYTVDRPVRRIVSAARKMTKGDFSVRISPVKGPGAAEQYNEIIDCLNILAQELSGVETLRMDFIANVSHELKTPLAVIQNYGTMLQQPGLCEELRVEYAKSISMSSQRLANLITKILELNKLENQQIFPNTKEYDLSEQLCLSLLQFEDIWESKNIEIETEIEDGVTIASDPELLELVWNNLISNAMKFTPVGGKVCVSLSGGNEYVTVSVGDTGCGMSPETGAHIYEKFYQGDTSHATEGNGLGLALVKRIIDITGSNISLQSELNKGSTFTVKLRKNGHATMEKVSS